MEASRAHLGPEAQLRDVQMVWPFVVPKDPHRRIDAQILLPCTHKWACVRVEACLHGAFSFLASLDTPRTVIAMPSR